MPAESSHQTPCATGFHELELLGQLKSFENSCKVYILYISTSPLVSAAQYTESQVRIALAGGKHGPRSGAVMLHDREFRQA